MTRFFTSDTHFGHKNIIRFSNRPFRDVEHMNEMLIKNWNDTVGPDDIVFHLGDVALGPWVEWDNVLTRLNGYKVLVVGNHDRIFKGEKPRMQERFAEHYNRWFDEVYDELLLHFEVGHSGHWAILSHFPYDGDSHGEERYREFRPVDEGLTLIHGHTHAEYDARGIDARVSRSNKGTPQIHVGQDAWNYRPVSEAEVVALRDSF